MPEYYDGPGPGYPPPGFPWWDQGGTPPPNSPGYPPEGAPPDTPFPGSPPSQPLPAPPSAQPPGQPPPDPTPPPTPPGDVSPWFAVGLGPFGSFFRPRVGRRLPSPFEQLVKTGLDATYRGVRDFLRPTRQLRFEPPGGKPPGSLPTRYVEPLPPTPRVMVTPISFIVGAILGGYPRGLFSAGEKPLTDLERISDPNAVFRMWDPQMMGLPDVPSPPVYRDPRRLPDLLLENLPAARRDPTFQSWLAKFMRGELTNLGPEWLASQVPGWDRREQGPPEPPKQNIADIRTAPVATPATEVAKQAAVPQQTIGPRSTTGRSSRARRNRIFTFGGIGTAVLLLEAARRGRGTSPVVAGSPGAPVSPVPIATPVPNPLTPVVPTVQGYSPYMGGGASGDGYCVPRPRGPRRKCLERAPVKYSGGRRKGKAAGTKCLRWEASKR